MPLLVRNLRLRLDEPEAQLVALAARRLRLPADAIRLWSPVRRSLDARRADDVAYVYNVELALHGKPGRERRLVRRLGRQDTTLIARPAREQPEPGSAPLPHRPVVVGFGPAGMFATLRLAEYGYRPVVLERGRDVRRRHVDVLKRFYREGVFDPESNLLFGEGGAGAYSDGKLYTRVNDPLVDDVLEVLFRHGAAPAILIDGRPHMGSDKLPGVCRRIRAKIESLGGEIRFGQRVEDFEITDGRLTALTVNGGRQPVGPVLLGVGHSARDTLRCLAANGVRISAKPFQLGLRIEHPQSMVDRWQYGAACGSARLPPADYRLVGKGAAGSRGDLFSFCMCPGGTILPSNESVGEVVTNGASRSTRGGPFANSGLVITVPPADFGDDPLAGVAMQEELERRAFAMTGGGYAVPAQRATDFLAGRSSDGAIETSYPLGGQWASLREVIPAYVAEAIARGIEMLDRRMKGFAGPDALLTGPETRASAPIRIDRDQRTRMSFAAESLYPIGEGAGYAGGIVSAAIDGVKTAEQIIRHYAPLG